MNYFQLSALISKLKRTSPENEQLVNGLRALKNGANGEPDFFAYCKKWKLAPWTYTQLQRGGWTNKISAEVLAGLAEIHLKTEQENKKRNAEAVRFLTALREKEIEVIILKGNLFIHTIYQDVGYKRMNDFDILIHKNDWEKIQDVYIQLGYIPLGFGWSGEKEKPAAYSHVGMSFISPDLSCIVGSQWGLKSPTTSYKVDIEDAWKTASNLDFYGVKVKQLSPEYNLLHLILHLGIFKCGVRDCMDIYNLCAVDKIDKKKFYQVVETAKAVDKSYFALSLSNLCSGDLTELISDLRPSISSFIMRRLQKRMAAFEKTKDLHDSYNDYFQDIEKVVIYFNLFPLFHKKLLLYLLILKMIYFPKTEMALKLNDASFKPTAWDKLKARLNAPYFVFALIAQEIGWTFTVLLFIKLFVDLLLSLKNYVIKKDSYFDYLKKRGTDPKAIENTVKNIQ